MGKFTVKEFVAKATAVHGDTYDYSKVVYETAHVHVEIGCKIHGSFLQSPANHIHHKAGCIKCMGEKFRATNDNLRDWITKARGVHGDKYSYKRAVYRGALRKLTIGCRNCRTWFEQTAASHLTGRGCLPCSARQPSITPTMFKARAEKASPNLTVVEASYRGFKVVVSTQCIKCEHEFTCSPQRLVEGVVRCPICDGKGHSLIACQWILHEAKKRRIHIQYAHNGGEFRIPGTRWRVDGYNKRLNMVFEFHGDCYHGNPNVYKPSANCHPFNKEVTAKQLYKRTLAREQALRDLGYTVVSIWESDWRLDRKSV